MIKRPSKNISLYINYPTEERLKQLRERVSGWNFIDKMKEKRLAKIATSKEIVDYLMGDAETIATVDSRQKEIDRRKNKQDDPRTPAMKKLADLVAREQHKQQDAELVKAATKYTLPTFVQDVLDGGAYPEQYECSIEEQKILYNQRFLELFQQYRTAKSQTTADIVLSQIVSLVKELDQ